MARRPTFGPTATDTVHAHRSGGWWALDVPELPGVHSQVRRLEQADDMIREAIALAFDVEPDVVRLYGPIPVVNDEVDDLLRTTRAQREELAGAPRDSRSVC